MGNTTYKAPFKPGTFTRHGQHVNSFEDLRDSIRVMVDAGSRGLAADEVVEGIMEQIDLFLITECPGAITEDPVQ